MTGAVIAASPRVRQASRATINRPFRWQSDRIHRIIGPETAQWFLSARRWPKSGSADEQGRTFSGLHGKNVLVLVDESGTIPTTVLRARRAGAASRSPSPARSLVANMPTVSRR